MRQELTASVAEACKGCEEGKGAARERLVSVSAPARVCVITPNKRPGFPKNPI